MKLIRAVGTKATLALLLVALAAGSVLPALAAPTAQQGSANARGVFGEVVSISDDRLVVRTAAGEDVAVVLTPDTEFRAPGADSADSIRPTPRERVAVVQVEQDGALVARTVMALSARARDQAGRVLHLRGVVTFTDDGVLIVTEDGTERLVDFGLAGNNLTEGTVVTVIGKIDPETGVVRVQAFQGVADTLRRLSDHLSEVERTVDDRDAQVKHLARVRKLVSQVGDRHIELVQKVQERLPEQAAAALDRALKNLDEAGRIADAALVKATEVAAKRASERKRPQDGGRLPDEARATLADVAQAFGITEPELVELLKRLRSIVAAAAERGVTIEDLQARVQDIVATRIRALVASGDLSPETAELIVSRLAANIAERLREAFENDDAKPDVPVTLEDLARLLGIEVEELVALLKDGATLEEIAERLGLGSGDLRDRIEELARARLQELIADGIVDADDVERFVEKLRKQIERALKSRRDDAPKPKDVAKAILDRVPFNFPALTEALGLTVQEIQALLREGLTVQQIATRQGVTLQEAVQKLSAALVGQLRKQVEAGRITEQEAQRLLAAARERLATQLREFVDKLNDRADDGDKPKPRPARAATPNPYGGIPLTLTDIATAIGVSDDELAKWLASSDGVRGLLEELGIEPQDISTTLLDTVRTRLEDLADVPSEKVGALLASLEKRLAADLLGKRAVRSTTDREGDHDKPAAFVPFDLGVVAQALSLSPTALQGALAEGRSVPEIAQALGVSLERLTDLLTAPLRRAADEARERGELDEGEVRAKLEIARDTIERNLKDFRVSQKERERQEDKRSELRAEAEERTRLQRENRTVGEDRSDEVRLRQRAEAEKRAEEARRRIEEARDRFESREREGDNETRVHIEVLDRETPVEIEKRTDEDSSANDAR